MHHQRVVETVEALDEALDEAAIFREQSDDAFCAALDKILFRPSSILGRVPRDPYGEEYRSAQLRLYDQLTQRPYDVTREETEFDRSHMLHWPFPYTTRSPTIVGNYLMIYGQIIKEMNLPFGAHILELGSGYGPLTYQLASMGYRVTCADISENLLEYVRARCSGLPGVVQTIRCDMNNFSPTGVYDGVVFFESFHHCLNHANLIQRVASCLDDHGIVVLAGEPIVPPNSDLVPYPWGLRMDGQSLWAIRRQGWLELGFRIDYLTELLRKTGWEHTRVPSPSLAGTDIWICRRAPGTAPAFDFANADVVQRWNANDTALFTQCGRLDPATGRMCSQGAAGYLCYGPYIDLDAGVYEVRWNGSSQGKISTAVADVAIDKGQHVLREGRIGRSEIAGVLARSRFHIEKPTRDVEFRIWVGSHDDVSLEGMELRRKQ
jgi:SAM-dependent methyltransferase